MEAEARLQQLAHHDPLTGLPNRAYMVEYLDRRIGHARRNKDRLAVFFLDLDGFKYINDTFGHANGDALLIQVAARLRNRLRQSDAIARLGGNEFVVLLEDITSADDTARVAAELAREIIAPVVVDDHELVVTTSIGISLYPEDGENSTELLKNADTAMYAAKSSGRNQYQFYAAEMSSHAQERLVVENELRQALDNGELVLYYQPRFALRDRTLTGMEALLRWHHPTRGLLTPASFLGIAEESGLILPIGDWVLHEACMAAMRWSRAGAEDVFVAVNIAEKQVFHGELLQSVEDALEASGLPAERLEIEITENVFMRNVDTAADVLKTLHNRGVRIAIDDFGTGYSSLNRLKTLPITGLKVDRIFVRDLPKDPADIAIVASVITLGHSLGMYVMAEGVETAQQVELLTRLGCDEGQGFLFARPMEENEILRRYVSTASKRSATIPG